MQREALKRSLPAPAFTRSSTRTVARVCASVLLANKQGESPVKFVQRNFPDDADAEWLTRAATTPTSTATGLAATVTAPFLRALAPVSAATRLFSRAMQLDFDGVYQYLVPTYSSAAPIPIFVGEGAPFPVVDAMLTNATVGPTKKILLGSAVTGELESASAESAAAIIGSILTYQTARAIDHYVFDDQPADDIRPQRGNCNWLCRNSRSRNRKKFSFAFFRRCTASDQRRRYGRPDAVRIPDGFHSSPLPPKCGLGLATPRHDPGYRNKLVSTMDEKARKVFERAYQTIDRVNAMEIPDEPTLDPELDAKIESMLEPDWTPPVPRKRNRRDTPTTPPVAIEQQTAEWANWIDSRMAAALDRFSDAYSVAVIQTVFSRIDKAKKLADDRADELEATIHELQAEVTVLREMIKSGSNVHIPGSSSHKVIVN